MGFSLSVHGDRRGGLVAGALSPPPMLDQLLLVLLQGLGFCLNWIWEDDSIAKGNLKITD